jgi:DNA-binding MarR family transcriptional regulator
MITSIICASAYNGAMSDEQPGLPPKERTASDEDLAEQVHAGLLALPLDELLRYWHRLTWWAAIWPLFQQMATIDLTLPEVMVLRGLKQRSPNVGEVATLLSLSHSAASRAVDRLVGAGLIDRQEDPADRRHKRLSPTAAGRARIQALEQVFGAELDAVVARLDHDAQRQLQRLFARIIAAYVGIHQDSVDRTAWARSLIDPPQIPDRIRLDGGIGQKKRSSE